MDALHRIKLMQKKRYLMFPRHIWCIQTFNCGLPKITFSTLAPFLLRGSHMELSNTTASFPAILRHFLGLQIDITWFLCDFDLISQPVHLSSMDYFLKSYPKDWIYRNRTQTLDQLWLNITMEIKVITIEALCRVSVSIVKHAQACIAVQGGHFKHML